MERSEDSATRRNGFAIARPLMPTLVAVTDCKQLGQPIRKHPPQQVRKLAQSLERFGFVLPILVDAGMHVVAGWGLLLAARMLGLDQVPVVKLTDLSEADLRVLRVALNRLGEDSSWDHEALRLEFSEMVDLGGADLQFTGFDTPEIDLIAHGNGFDQEDEVPESSTRMPAVNRPGDLWHLDDHLVFCGDALADESYRKLLGVEKIHMMFADPPFNARIAGHVSGLGKIKHREFAHASGELSAAQFIEFLKTSLALAANHSVNGCVHFVCMDWRHLPELFAAAGPIYAEQLNLCVWNKTNAGMGSLYRSKHELILVYRVGKARHINNVSLGRFGRNRTNVWDYVSQNTLNGTTKSKLALHPTVKPVAMVADAICDCSNRGGLILDPFGGAGTTLIAAERTGRRARIIEIDPIFADVTIERWQRLTGRKAIHAESGQPFAR